MKADTLSLSKSSPLLHVLRIHSFRSLWLAQVLSQLAVNMMLFVLALRIYQHTQSNAAVSGLFIAYGVPALTFGLLAGAVVDHFDKRYVLLWCNLLRAILVCGLFLVSTNIFAIYTIAFFHAIITQFYVPAEAPLLPSFVPKHYLVSANSLFTFTYYTSMAGGFILAGPLLKNLGPVIAFAVICSMFVWAALHVLHVPKQGNTYDGFKALLKHNIFAIVSRIFRDMSDGVKQVSKSPKLIEALLLLTGTQVVIAILGTLGPGFADRVLQVEVTDASVVVLAPIVAGIVVGALWVGSYSGRFKPNAITSFGIVSAGIILAAIAIVLRLDGGILSSVVNEQTIVPISFSLFFLLGIANSFLDVPANSTLQEADPSIRGRVYGLLTALVGGVGMLPVAMGGVLADALGVGTVILVLGIGIVGYGWYRISHVPET